MRMGEVYRELAIENPIEKAIENHVQGLKGEREAEKICGGVPD